jgi:surface carbohydrate biosynthesis protein
LGRKLHINYLINNLKGYIYIDKGYHKGVSKKLYAEIKKNNGTIINLDEEGGVDFNDGSTIRHRYTKTLFDNAYLTFMWGNQQYELVKKNMNKENKVAVTGHPRFELLKPEFHYLYEDEVNKIIIKYKDFILINTNMSFGNNIRGDKFVKAKYGSRFKKVDQIIEFDKLKLDAYQSLIQNLSYQLDKTIIIRPHPEEDHSFYLDAFNDIGNIHVVYEGSVIPWILAADFMIHPDCTTGIESLFLGKKSLSFLPEDYPEDLITFLPLEASECFTSESDIISFINNNIDSTKKVDFKKYPFAEDYFSISKPSTELIVDSFCQLRKTSKKNKSHNLTLMNLLYLKYSSARGILGERKKSSRLGRNKLKGFDTKNINKIHKKITSYNKQMLKIGCKTINRNLFMFEHLR